MRYKRHSLAQAMLIQAALLLIAACGFAEEFTTQQLAQKFTASSVWVDGSLSSDPDHGAFGTGFILSEDGLVVTNFHVIEGFDQLSVRSSTGGTYVVKRVLATDKKLDIAILEIEGHNLPKVE